MPKQLKSEKRKTNEKDGAQRRAKAAATVEQVRYVVL